MLEHTFEGGFSDRLVGNRLVPPEDYFSDRGMQENASGFARAASQAKALKKAGARLGRVLDYGSGPGYFLKVAAPETAFAIEPDPDSAKYLDYLGATRLDEDALDEMQFDAIVASHVIEHFTETDVVRRVGRMVAALAPDGRLLIEVPQGGHSRLHLTARDDPHTLFFTAAGLRALVERAGGQVVACFVRSKATHQVREDAIYRPDPNDSFASTLGGGLTVIARPSA
ncbi:MAG: class I SAM-dependent methyltransferase [Rhodobacter sp.]|nr:class I SAM-dependent methyltransferase [Rhodobacter sp.]